MSSVRYCDESNNSIIKLHCRQRFSFNGSVTGVNDVVIAGPRAWVHAPSSQQSLSPLAFTCMHSAPRPIVRSQRFVIVRDHGRTQVSKSQSLFMRLLLAGPVVLFA